MAESKDSDLGGGANQNPGDEQNSEITKTLDTLLAGFKGIEERFVAVEAQQKALQGDKDRGVNQAIEDSKEAKEGFAEFREYTKKYGDDAEQRFEQDQTLKRLAELADTLEAAQKKSAEAEQAANADVVDPELLKKYGIDLQSPEYLAQAKGGLTGLDAVLATAKGSKPPEPNEGEATGASGGAGGSGTTQTAQAILKSDFNKALDDAAKETGHLTPRALQAIEDEYTKKGLLTE